MSFFRVVLQFWWIYAFSLLNLGCGSNSDKADNLEPVTTNYQYTVPSANIDDWPTDHADNHNVDLQRLSLLMDAIENGDFFNIDSIVIIRNGLLIFDELIRTELDSNDAFIGNSNLRVHSAQSVTKSIVSALVGIAIDKEHISSVNSLFYDHFPEYSSIENPHDLKSNITLEDVLTMRHGLTWDEFSYPYNDPRNDLSTVYGSSNDYVKSFLDLPIVTEPGTTFTYSTVASIALGAAVENRSKVPLEEFAESNLFNPLGITSPIWAFTPQGRINTGGGLWISSRDMAKIGQLYLNNGVWNGEQVLSSNWVEASMNDLVFLGYSHSDYYNYQWWTKTFTLDDNREIFTYSAHGNGGQFIFVIPSLQSVVVFTGSNYSTSVEMFQPIDMMKDYILPAIH